MSFNAWLKCIVVANAFQIIISQNVAQIKIDEKFKELNLSDHSVTWIYTRPSHGDRFLLFEGHSVASNIIMSKERLLSKDCYENSTNPAIVSVTLQKRNSSEDVGVYIMNNHHSNVRVFVRVTEYSIEDPVPGWCSNRLGIWPRPGLTVDENASKALIKLNFSLAATDNYKDCTHFNEIEYQVYHLYQEPWSAKSVNSMEERLFESLKKFKDIDSAMRYGTMVNSLGPHLDRLVFAAYPGVGSVYAVVAKAANGSSLYGLAHSYGCDLDPITRTCLKEDQTLLQIFCACSLFAGLLLAFAGHKFFLGSQIMFGFYAGVYIGFILLKVFCSLNMNFLFFLVMACGVCMSIAVVAVWVFLAVPVVSVILPTVEVGVIFASIILYLPQTNTISLVTNLNYWLVYFCCVLAAPICLLAFTQKAHILACVLVGTTLTILPVDFYLGTGLRYMFLNVIRRAHVSHYNEAILVPVFQSGDLILLACWFALASVSLLCQLLVQRKRPPFPPSPFQQWKWRREASREQDEESEPLLVDEDEVTRPYEVRQVVGFIEPRQRQRERNEVQRKPRDVFTPSAPENLS